MQLGTDIPLTADSTATASDVGSLKPESIIAKLTKEGKGAIREVTTRDYQAPVFIKMTAAKYATKVPVGINNRSYFDDEGTEFVRLWSEWKDDYHYHIPTCDGGWIVPGNSFGAELTAEEIALLTTGYTILMGSEVEQYRVVVE